MGRNSIPKLGEWSDGHLYEFKAHGTTRAGKSEAPIDPNDGRSITYERTNAPYLVNNNGVPVTETLAFCYADGFQECMASMWQSGYNKGYAAGREEALRDVRRTMGIKED